MYKLFTKLKYFIRLLICSVIFLSNISTRNSKNNRKGRKREERSENISNRNDGFLFYCKRLDSFIFLFFVILFFTEYYCDCICGSVNSKISCMGLKSVLRKFIVSITIWIIIQIIPPGNYVSKKEFVEILVKNALLSFFFYTFILVFFGSMRSGINDLFKKKFSNVEFFIPILIVVCIVLEELSCIFISKVDVGTIWASIEGVNRKKNKDQEEYEEPW